MKDHKKNSHPAPDPREVRRQNLARFGSTMTPGLQTADPALLASALSMCASAGLPDPVVTIESVTDGATTIDVEVYTFVHIQIPQLSFRTTQDEVALYPEQVIRICKGAGIKSASLPIVDDPPIVADPPPPPPVV